MIGSQHHCATVLRSVGARVRIWHFSVVRNRGQNAVCVGAERKAHRKLARFQLRLIGQTIGLVDIDVRFRRQRRAPEATLTCRKCAFPASSDYHTNRVLRVRPRSLAAAGIQTFDRKPSNNEAPARGRLALARCGGKQSHLP